MAEGIGPWRETWQKNVLGWHLDQVHGMLLKHGSLLFGDKKLKRVFVPLCGKTVDIKWMLDMGHTVVGLDGVRKALEELCNDHSFQWEEEDALNMDSGCHKIKVRDTNLNLYFGNMLLFNKSIEEQFDCIWDRGSIVALDRKDVKRYVEIIKDILKPGGKILVEVFDYDLAIFEEDPLRPPPYPMSEGEIKDLYEPDCSVQSIDTGSRTLGSKELKLVYYLVVKH